MTDSQPGCLTALWLVLVAFLSRLFPNSPGLPTPATATVKEPTPLKHTRSAASSSSARTSPTPDFHPPPIPFPPISLSGIFATSVTEPGPTPPASSPPTPRTPSSRIDRSAISPSTVSDASFQVISLADTPSFQTDKARLPSPWSPVGKTTSSNVWIALDGTLRNAAGPMEHTAVHSRDTSAAARTTVLSPLAASASLYSSTSALDALGISVFVNLDEAQDQDDNVDHDAVSTPRLNQVRDEKCPTLVRQDPHTPCKHRETLPSISGSNPPSSGARSVKYYSTPLTKLDNVSISHVHSTSSISSMTYQLRLGLFADGRSMTAIQNILSLLDQVSPEPERVPTLDDTMPVEVV